MFKVGDVVEINPNWKEKDTGYGNYGISQWKEHLGETYIIEYVGTEDLILAGSPFIWPQYMIRHKSILANLIDEWRRENEN